MSPLEATPSGSQPISHTVHPRTRGRPSTHKLWCTFTSSTKGYPPVAAQVAQRTRSSLVHMQVVGEDVAAPCLDANNVPCTSWPQPSRKIANDTTKLHSSLPRAHAGDARKAIMGMRAATVPPHQQSRLGQSTPRPRCWPATQTSGQIVGVTDGSRPK